MDPGAVFIFRLLGFGLAIFLVAQFVRRVILARDLPYAVFLGQAVAIPAAGFVVYLLDPFSFDSIVLVFAGTAFAAIALALAPWIRYRDGVESTTAMDRSTLERRARVRLVLQGCLAAAMTLYVLGLEPVFAFANVAINVLWVLAWVPPWWREFRIEDSIEINQPAAVVWEYISDPSHAPAYQVGVDRITVSPSGKLQIGTRITALRRVPLIRPWYGRDELLMRIESEIVEVVPGSCFTAVSTDRRTRTTTEVTSNPDGCMVRTSSQFVDSIAAAILGTALESRRRLPISHEMAATSLSRLRDALGTPSD